MYLLDVSEREMGIVANDYNNGHYNNNGCNRPIISAQSPIVHHIIYICILVFTNLYLYCK